MPKPRSSELDKECPICGGIIWGKGQKVLLEGAKITVCDNCAQHGTKIYKPSTNVQIKKTAQRKPQTTLKKQTYKPKGIGELEIVLDYAKRIRKVRSNIIFN